MAKFCDNIWKKWFVMKVQAHSPASKEVERMSYPPRKMHADQKDKRSELWKASEQYAVDYLTLEGYTIRERNWKPRNSHLEVDIIAQIDNIIVFVEVKARSNGATDPLDAIDREKMRNLCRAAEKYLFTDSREDLEYRFDFISISGEPGSFELDHVPDAFYPHNLY